MKVFIVEDAAIMLANLQSTLSDIAGVTVIGSAANEADALKRIDALLPDLVIIEISLRDGVKLGMLESLKTRHPRIKAMMLTDCNDEFYADHYKRAGADYFFDKAFQLMRVHSVVWQLAYANCPDNRCEALQTPGV